MEPYVSAACGQNKRQRQEILWRNAGQQEFGVGFESESFVVLGIANEYDAFRATLAKFVEGLQDERGAYALTLA